MGNCGKKMRQSWAHSYYRTRNGNVKLSQAVQCPKCHQIFGTNTSYNAFNNHLDHCLNSSTDESVDQLFSMQINLTLNQDNSDEKIIWVKTQKQNGESQWEKKQFEITQSFEKIKSLTASEAKILNFEEKQLWFRYNLEKLRISWKEGCDQIYIAKNNVLLDSLEFLDCCNFHKEIKIYIEQEKVNDAGGLLREWISLLSKEIFSSQNNYFKLADVDKITYRINSDCRVTDFNLNVFKLVGKLLGKAIFEKIPLNAYFNRPFIKQLLGQSTSLEDIQEFDKYLHQSWKYILENKIDNEEFFQEYFVISTKTNSDQYLVEEELKTNGKNIKVSDENKQEYVIPKEYISIFNYDEFEMILNGLPFIDVNDWCDNTEYKGAYYNNHQVIKWFWQVMKEFNQKELGKFLKFCTGSNRTSVEGFRYLETNRGNVSKFLIESTKFSKQNPFPQAYTCFNRLVLPMYISYEDTKQYMHAIVDNELDGVFGLD